MGIIHFVRSSRRLKVKVHIKFPDVSVSDSLHILGKWRYSSNLSASITFLHFNTKYIYIKYATRQAK